MEKKKEINFIRVLIKATILFLLLNMVWAVVQPELRLSIYDHLVPGRPRLPFGEVPELAYNFSLDNIAAMFESHEIETYYMDEEYSVYIVGDSSVWGTLLKPEETLQGQLNQLNLTHKETGLPVRFYNLGYPTLSLTKDVMLIDEAIHQYHPDMILWMVTLESMPWTLQQRSPFVENNPERLLRLDEWYGLSTEKGGTPAGADSFWDKTIIGQRRNIADVFRLQFYGFLWWATGIDQYYPDQYTPATWDLKEDASYYNYQPDTFSKSDLAFELIQGGIDLGKYDRTDFLIVNEPILISEGQNSDIRYNFYYPRWIYDQYRELIKLESFESNWDYYDLWDSVPAEEFTNSAIHLTPDGEKILADEISSRMINESLWEIID